MVRSRLRDCEKEKTMYDVERFSRLEGMLSVEDFNNDPR